MSNLKILMAISLLGAGCQMPEKTYMVNQKYTEELKLSRDKGLVENTQASVKVSWKD
jgi:hypothetical protein